MTNARVAVLFGNPAKAEPYEVAVRSVGLEPVGNPDDLGGIEGIVLTGGTDINPRLYGAEPHPETQPPDDDRDSRELGLLTEALQLDVPVLAICRGLQLFNVFHGGTLVQHLDRGPHGQREVADAHAIAIESDSRLARILERCDYTVNSRHHQAAGRVGAGLRVTARCPSDDVIEALENTACRFALAVQWHPEDRIGTHDGDRRLFEAFARAIAENRK